MLRTFAAFLALVAGVWFGIPAALSAADDGLPASVLPTFPLEGTWAVESAEQDGGPAPERIVKSLRFTFRNDELTLHEPREQPCTYVLDEKASPARLDFSPKPTARNPLPPEGSKKPTIAAIYKRSGDWLTVAFRHASDERGRPDEFISKPHSGVVLVVFKKVDENK